jgi:predicted enzyme related to lactoylglutathione lyase
MRRISKLKKEALRKMRTGTVGWIDLTIEDAQGIRAFYQSVVGWETNTVSMDGYGDFSMHPPGAADPVTGLCHARGANAEIPPAWVVYFIVDDLDGSMQACANGGGKVVSGPRTMGKDRCCIIEDPAGTVCALYQPGE